jgi:hypothetical protein
MSIVKVAIPESDKEPPLYEKESSIEVGPTNKKEELMVLVAEMVLRSPILAYSPSDSITSPTLFFLADPSQKPTTLLFCIKPVRGFPGFIYPRHKGEFQQSVRTPAMILLQGVALVMFEFIVGLLEVLPGNTQTT